MESPSTPKPVVNGAQIIKWSQLLPKKSLLLGVGAAVGMITSFMINRPSFAKEESPLYTMVC
jgi:hypothetical protein